MPLKPASYKTVERKLKKAGFVVISQTGSHVKFAKVEARGTRTAIVPKHKEIAVGTLSSILRQAGISPAEFEQL